MSSLDITGSNNTTNVIMASNGSTLGAEGGKEAARVAGGCGSIWIEELFICDNSANARALAVFIDNSMARPQIYTSPYESWMLSLDGSAVWCIRKIAGPNALVGLAENARSAVASFTMPGTSVLQPYNISSFTCYI